MRVGIVGLGRLGLPVAVALASRFEVVGFDTNPALCNYRPYEHQELGPTGRDDFQEYFRRAVEGNDLYFVADLRELAKLSDIIFLAIQTPHRPELDGSTVLSCHTADFDYSYLIEAAERLAPLVSPEQMVAVISTVLPGTIRRHVLPILGDKCKVVYNPFFIALGTVMQDFLNPEFVLIGGERANGQGLINFYHHMGLGRFCRGMSIESAELTKMAYNAFLTTKITFVNTLMELAHKIPGCNVDDVVGTLAGCTTRLLAPKFFTPGMSFGGACFPRDLIALSWLAEQKSVGFNLFEALAHGRQEQTLWLAELIVKERNRTGLPVVILGKAFKPGTKITAGSPALLLADFLKRRGVPFEHFDHNVDDGFLPSGHKMLPSIFFIATEHRDFAKWAYPPGSVILDPFRRIEPREGVKVIPIGIGPEV